MGTVSSFAKAKADKYLGASPWDDIPKDETLTGAATKALIYDPWVDGIVNNTADRLGDLLSNSKTSVNNVVTPLKEPLEHPIKHPFKLLGGILKSAILAPTEALSMAGNAVSNVVHWTNNAIIHAAGKPLARMTQQIGRIPLVGWLPKYALNAINWLAIKAPTSVIEWTREKVGNVLGYPRNFIREKLLNSKSANGHESEIHKEPHSEPHKGATVHQLHHEKNSKPTPAEIAAMEEDEKERAENPRNVVVA
jgi:hypothetical protein